MKPRPTADQLLASLTATMEKIDLAFTDYPVTRQPSFITNPPAPRRPRPTGNMR